MAYIFENNRELYYYPYIKTKPLHESQRIVELRPTGAIVEIDVYVNFELKQLLLSYGKDLVVLSPESLRAAMKEIFASSLENYQ